MWISANTFYIKFFRSLNLAFNFSITHIPQHINWVRLMAQVGTWKYNKWSRKISSYLIQVLTIHCWNLLNTSRYVKVHLTPFAKFIISQPIMHPPINNITSSTASPSPSPSSSWSHIIIVHHLMSRPWRFSLACEYETQTDLLTKRHPEHLIPSSNEKTVWRGVAQSNAVRHGQ